LEGRQALVTGSTAGMGLQQAIARFAALDILVNNLGIFEVKPFEQISDDDWFHFFE
jgi:NAD(P)-dependent dehydrogenase (short-subunit alcohol dehydrogenase family)